MPFHLRLSAAFLSGPRAPPPIAAAPGAGVEETRGPKLGFRRPLGYLDLPRGPGSADAGPRSAYAKPALQAIGTREASRERSHVEGERSTGSA